MITNKFANAKTYLKTKVEPEALTDDIFHHHLILTPLNTYGGTWRLTKQSIQLQEALWNMVKSYWDNMDGHVLHRLVHAVIKAKEGIRKIFWNSFTIFKDENFHSNY